MIEKKVETVVKQVEIAIEGGTLEGSLSIPPQTTKLVVFAHGSGSSRHSSRNQMVARFLQRSSMATLLFDLLTNREDQIDKATRELRFNIPLLAERLIQTTEWLDKQKETKHLSIGYFGASTGAAAALLASAELGDMIHAVVSRGGRPDLAGHVLDKVKSATLLIVGGNDFGVIELNQHAFDLIGCKKKLEIIPGATHLFEETGALEEVSRIASVWFEENL